MSYFRRVSWLVIAVGLAGCNGKASSGSGGLRDGSAGMSGEDNDATMISAGGGDSGSAGTAGTCVGVNCPDADSPPITPDDCGNLDGLDAGPMQLRTCSDSALKPVLWENTFDQDNNPVCGPTPLTERCPLRWGCDDFDVARDTAAQCNSGPYRGGEHTGRGWGFLIIEEWFGASTVRGYYDENTGKLIGYWEMDDVGEEVCSGTVPRLSWNDGVVTDIEQLCTPDGGSLGHVDAGDGG